MREGLEPEFAPRIDKKELIFLITGRDQVAGETPDPLNSSSSSEGGENAGS